MSVRNSYSRGSCSQLACRLLLLALLTMWASPARAQVGAAPRPAQPPRARRQVQARRVGQPARRAISDQQFDSWVFREDHSAEAARRRQESVLALKVEEIDRACRLTEQQKQKLQLTGQGDIKRFFDKYELLKEKAYATLDENQNLNTVFQETTPLASILQVGLFGSGSLFQRSFHTTLTSAQMANYDAISRERIQFRHNANIDLVVTTLEESVPLPSVQRQKLVHFLRQELKAPSITGNYDFYYIMWQLGTIPEEKLKPFFDATQWRIVDRFVTQYKGMEPTLRQSGYFKQPDGEVEGPDADAIVPN
jgi:hypothetical protein